MLGGIDNSNAAAGLGNAQGAQPKRTHKAPTGPAPDAGALAVVAGDRSATGVRKAAAKLDQSYAQLAKAVAAGDKPEAARQLAELQTQADALYVLTLGTPFEAKFARIEQMLPTIAQHVKSMPDKTTPDVEQPTAEAADVKDGPKQQIMVGLPGRGGVMVDVDATAPTPHNGPLGFLGTASDFGAGALETVGHVLFAPLEFVGKLTDPLRAAVGAGLSQVRKGIDGSLGQIPLLGMGVRFMTGLLNSAVGLVNGAVQAVTHPVELIKGLASMAWSISGLIPFVSPRALVDMAVNGKSPAQSWKDAQGECLNIAKGFFHNAAQDLAEGNFAGAIGQVTGDVGSFLVSGGVGGAAKVAATGSRVAEVATASRLSRLISATRIDRVVGSTVRAGLNTSGKVFSLGLRGNFAAWNGVTRITSHIPGLRTISRVPTAVADQLRFRYLNRNPNSLAQRQELLASGGRTLTPAQIFDVAPNMTADFLKTKIGTKVRLPATLVSNPAKAYKLESVANGRLTFRSVDGTASETLSMVKIGEIMAANRKLSSGFLKGFDARYSADGARFGAAGRANARVISPVDVVTNNPRATRAFSRQYAETTVRVPKPENPAELRPYQIASYSDQPGKIMLYNEAHEVYVDPAMLLKANPTLNADFLKTFNWDQTMAAAKA